MKTNLIAALSIACLTLTGAALAAGRSAQPEPAAPPAKAKTDAPAAPAEEKYVYVKMTVAFTDPTTNPPAPTTGEIVLELNETKAPISTQNFVQYVRDGHYDGTIFHRVIPNFMIQGGGFSADMRQKDTRAPIKNEWQNGLTNKRGTIAMARTSIADSATSQFFINVVDNAALDQPRDGAAYAVFGKVVSGLEEVVDKIRKVPTGRRGPHNDVPAQTVTITKAEVVAAPGK